MNTKITAVLLIVAAVLANLAFTVLGTVFGYPDILIATKAKAPGGAIR